MGDPNAVLNRIYPVLDRLDAVANRNDSLPDRIGPVPQRRRRGIFVVIVGHRNQKLRQERHRRLEFKLELGRAADTLKRELQ